ncbi:hypothetical protein [uncultured Gimesia sp.]|uniref:hypothetical protein n=1 Tax=uncultured Gimesia sp. TaxID=1678688 RepID=UPI00262E9A14|nr:hypothetical protein [uncultured Gimesia sp.]
MDGLVFGLCYLLFRWSIVFCFDEGDFLQRRGEVKSGLLQTGRRRAPVRDLCGALCDLLVAVGRQSVPNLSAHFEPGGRTGRQIGLKPASLMVSVFTGALVCTMVAYFLRARRVTRILVSGGLLSRPGFSVANGRPDAAGFFSCHTRKKRRFMSLQHSDLAWVEQDCPCPVSADFEKFCNLRSRKQVNLIYQVKISRPVGWI